MWIQRALCKTCASMALARLCLSRCAPLNCHKHDVNFNGTTTTFAPLKMLPAFLQPATSVANMAVLSLSSACQSSACVHML